MRSGLARFIPFVFILVGGSAHASVDLLFDRVASFRNEDLLIVPVETRGRFVFLPRLQNAKLNRQKKFLLGSDGRMYELFGDVTDGKYRLAWGCSETQSAARLVRKGRGIVRGRFVVIGDNADQKLKWSPVRRFGARRTPEQCQAGFDGFIQKDALAFGAAVTPGVFVTSQWISRHGARCPTWRGSTVSYFDPKRQECQVVYKAETGCELDPGERLNGLVGSLTLNGEETWLLFKSRLGSREGYAAVRWNESRSQRKLKIADSVHPWGCS